MLLATLMGRPGLGLPVYSVYFELSEIERACRMGRYEVPSDQCLVRLPRQKNLNTTSPITAMAKTPPITPPTIAPIGVDFFVLSASLRSGLFSEANCCASVGSNKEFVHFVGFCSAQNGIAVPSGITTLGGHGAFSEEKLAVQFGL